MKREKPLNILTWCVQESYLYYLSQIPHNLFLPVLQERSGDYRGKGTCFDWGENVIEIPADQIRGISLDCILFQRPSHFLSEQYFLLSEEQRELPCLFLEHEPPQEHPTNMRHCVDSPQVLLIHTSPFNQLMWDNGKCFTSVIEHGISLPRHLQFTGEIEKGIALMPSRNFSPRKSGTDIFERIRKKIPVDVLDPGNRASHKGMSHWEFLEHISRYRFFFNPRRYGSLDLTLCEAMALGMPVVALSTTDLSSIVHHQFNGYAGTNIDELISIMDSLLNSRELALEVGNRARQSAGKRFRIGRFIDDWNKALWAACHRKVFP